MMTVKTLGSTVVAAESIGSLGTPRKPLEFHGNSHPTYRYKLVKEPPEKTERRDALPAVGEAFDFWHWGDTVIGLVVESGRTFDIPVMTGLVDGGYVELIETKKQRK